MLGYILLPPCFAQLGKSIRGSTKFSVFFYKEKSMSDMSACLENICVTHIMDRIDGMKQVVCNENITLW